VKVKLVAVVKLRYSGKKGSTAAANEILEAIPNGNVPFSNLDKLAKSLEVQLFRVGGFATIKAVLDKLLKRSLIQLVLPEGSAAKNVDQGSIKDDILAAAKDFLKNLMYTKGRRTDLNSNAFWAAAAALLPRNLLANRKGRAAMRVLDLNYRVVKRAGEIRGKMEDVHGGWKRIDTCPHKDRADWNELQMWFHSEEASTEDNDNKRMVRVVVGLEDDGMVLYEEHVQRYLAETMGILHARFQKSAQYGIMIEKHLAMEKEKRRKRAIERVRSSKKAELAVAGVDAKAGALAVDAAGKGGALVGAMVAELGMEYKKKEGTRRAQRAVLKNLRVERRAPTVAEVNAAVATTPEYPELIASMKQFRKYRCTCCGNRHGSECDCTLCTYVLELTCR
jgi:hypothetical protein